MVDDGRTPLERSLAALSSYLFGGRVLMDTLQEISDRSLEALPSADFIAVIVALSGKPETPLFSDERALHLDEVQYAADRGPCLDSYRDGQLYVIDDTRTDARWPEFCDAAPQRGVLSTMSLPLTAADVRLGAMNLYSSAPVSFGKDEQRVGATFAAQASILLANAQAYHDAQTLSDNLAAAMRSRAVIEQAKGVIMAATGSTDEEAFDQLSRQSQHENIKLRELATETVLRAQRRPPPAR